MTIQDIEPRQMRASEVYGDYWFNGDPVSVSAERGRVVLVDFWDCSSTESIRAVPYVADWHRKYGPSGLIVLGVHSPRYRFGREPGVVHSALRRYDITYPVAMDNEHLAWTRSGIRTWPTKLLIDREGFVRYRSTGDSGYARLEHALQALMRDADLLDELPLLTEPLREEDRPGALLYRTTPEVLAGYLRGSLGNVEGAVPESLNEFVDPGMYLPGRMYLNGVWMNERDCVRSAGGPGGATSAILPYTGSGVNVVLEPPRGKRTSVHVMQDGVPPLPQHAGADVEVMPDGTCVVSVSEPRVYNVVRNPAHGDHTLLLKPVDDGTGLYGFTCLSSVIPDVISRN